MNIIILLLFFLNNFLLKSVLLIMKDLNLEYQKGSINLMLHHILNDVVDYKSYAPQVLLQMIFLLYYL